MSLAQTVRVAAIDTTPVEGGKRCGHCGRVKPRHDFHCCAATRTGLNSWCKACSRVAQSVRRQDPEVKARQRARQATPAALARSRAYQEAHRDQAKAARAAWRATPRGKMVLARAKARARLRGATADWQRARLTARLDSINAELARMDAAEGEGRPMNGLTPAQVRALDAARSIAAEGGFPYGHFVADRLGISISSAARHRTALVALGLWPWPVSRATPHRPEVEVEVGPDVQFDAAPGPRRSWALVPSEPGRPVGFGHAPAASFPRPDSADSARDACRRYLREWRGLGKVIGESGKRCVRCGEVKSREDFGPVVQMADGLSSWCRKCYRAKGASRRTAEREAQS